MQHHAAAVRFLLLCSQPSPGPHRVATIRRMMRGALPWKEVVDCAHWHDVCPLMYSVLKELPEYTTVPLQTKKVLETGYADHVIRNLRIYGELRRVLEAFQSTNIDALPLKGAALAEPLYRDIAARPMGDIDLLVRTADLSGAERALRGAGYTPDPAESSDAHRRNHYHITYFHDLRQVPIELHWGIGRPREPSRIHLHDPALVDRWFTRAVSMNLAGAPARVPAAHDLLLHLCVHFLKHRFPGNGGLASAGALLQLADIALVSFRSPGEVSWDVLYEETERYHLTGAVGAVLRMARMLTDEEARPALDVRFSHLGADDEAAMATMWRRMFSHEDARLRFTAVDLRFLQSEGTRRLRHLASTLFPSRERLTRQQESAPNSNSIYLEYLRRPVELHRIWRRLRSEPVRAHEEARLRQWLGFDG